MELKMKPEWKRFSLAMLFLTFTALLFLFAFTTFFVVRSDFIAENGVLDLRSLEAEPRWMVELRGEWEFLPGELVRPGMNFGADDAIKAEVPGSWGRLRDVRDRRLGGTGVGTYRLRILLPEDCPGNRSLSLKLLEIYSASEGYLNESALFASGRVAESRKEGLPGHSSGVYTFMPDEEVLELLIPVSNFHHFRGGLREPLMLGTTDRVFQQAAVNFSMQAFIFGALLIMAIYHIALFLAGRKGLQILYLGLACLVLALRVMLSGSRLLQTLWPGISWKLLLLLDMDTVALGFALMWGYFVRVYKEARVFKFDLVAVILHLGLGGLLTVLPYRWGYLLLFPYSLLILISFGYFLYLILWGIRKKVAGSVVQLIAAGVFSVMVLMDILYEFEMHNIFRLSNASAFGMVIYLFSNIYGLSVRYTRHKQVAEELTHRLEESVQERTEELEAANRNLGRTNRKLQEANAKLEQMAITDHLTGLFNRQEFSRKLQEMESDEGSGRVAALYIDLDNFKYYNDIFGHPLGDAILGRIASIIRLMAGKKNSAYRVGGDEFVILMANATGRAAAKVAENILDDVSRQDFSAEIRALGENDKVVIPEKEISCSIGIAMRSAGSEIAIEQLVADADTAMRDAKKSGKNRFLVRKQ